MPKLFVILGLIIGLAGCAQSGEQQSSVPLSMSTSAWTFDGRPARIIKTDHYLIHTTIDDTEFLESLVQVMEGALKQYQSLTPGVEVSQRPLECYVFARRPQWAQFTKEKTGADSAVYLQINRGGYTVADWFVSYFIGDTGTYAVVAHEGWHQYVARHFHSRLPPFLEEGIATMFENITWPDRHPHWDTMYNPTRADRLRTAIQDRTLWPLDQLCTMHAGDVVSLSGERIETFYAQDWAFAQFMCNAQNGKYRPALQRMLHDLATGETALAGPRLAPGRWDPRTVRPLLEHYLGMPIAQIDKEYQAFMRQLAYSRHAFESAI